MGRAEPIGNQPPLGGVQAVMIPSPRRRFRSVLQVLAGIAVLTMSAIACGGSEGDGSADDTMVGQHMARNLPLDRLVTVTYQTDFEDHRGVEFVVRVTSEYVAAVKERFGVELSNGSGVIQDTCEEALGFAEEQAERVGAESRGVCIPRTIDVLEPLHEIRRIVDTESFELQLSTEVERPYEINISTWPDDGCPIIGSATLADDATEIHVVVDSQSCA